MKCLRTLRKGGFTYTFTAALFYIGFGAFANSQEPGSKQATKDTVLDRSKPQLVQVTPFPSPGPVKDPNVKQAQEVPPVTPPPVQPPPVQPPPVQPPPVQPLPEAGGAGNLFGGVAPPPDLSPERAATVTTVPASQGASGAQAPVLGSTDVGDFLRRSDSFTGIEAQRRSPIANDPRVRGYHLGQLITVADGAYWFPARQDLDTYFSKIDSDSIKNVVVIKNPYSAHYGPGFSFIDIVTQSAPVYKNGFEWHSRTNVLYKFNGQQLYGREAVDMGDDRWGVYVSYGQRTASDYESGDDTRVPSGYNIRDVNAVIGFSPSADSRIEFGYLRLDQTGLKFPGEVFDTDFLVTNAYRLHYTLENQDWFDLLSIYGWYNRTSMKGNAQNPAKRATTLRALGDLSVLFTDIDLASSGYRASLTWGKDAKEPQFTIGTDMRWLDSALNEFDTLSFAMQGGMLPCGTTQNFPIPRNHQLDLGTFIEYVNPCSEDLVIRIGARGDYVASDVRSSSHPGFTTCDQFDTTVNLPPEQGGLGPFPPGTPNLEREAGLWLLYTTAEYKLTPHLTVTGGTGHAESPPTPTELYAMGPFLAILQQGLTTVKGNPGLAPEQLWQLDLGLRANFDRFRGGVNGFYGFIQEYITYQVLGPAKQGALVTFLGVPNALDVRFVNTELATLGGFELIGEYDVFDWLTPYANMSYVSGRDRTRDHRGVVIPGGPNLGANGASEEPLPGIPPLEARLGLRFHEAIRNPRYAMEFEARLVAPQDQVALSLGELPSAGFTIFSIRGYWQASKAVLVTAGIDNLFDRNYREHLDLRTGGFPVLQPGISPYLGMEVRW